MFIQILTFYKVSLNLLLSVTKKQYVDQSDVADSLIIYYSTNSILWLDDQHILFFTVYSSPSLKHFWLVGQENSSVDFSLFSNIL